jgi:hypothetical protein
MSDYTRVTNFTPKDSLPTGDPEKVVSGQEIQVELDAIAVAIATKSESGGGGSGIAGVGATPVSVAANFTSDAASPFVSVVIPANSIGAYGLLEIDSFFVLSGTGGPDTIVLDLALGTLTLRISVALSTSSGDLAGYIHVKFTVQNLGATNSQAFAATATFAETEDGANGNSGVQSGTGAGTAIGVPGSLDTTASQTFTITDGGSPSVYTVTHRATIARVLS